MPHRSLHVPEICRLQNRAYRINAPPNFPSGFQTTSIAAFPFVLSSSSRGMYAVSLHGSNSEYFADFEKMFCAAPKRTAKYRGVMFMAVVGCWVHA